MAKELNRIQQDSGNLKLCASSLFLTSNGYSVRIDQCRLVYAGFQLSSKSLTPMTKVFFCTLCGEETQLFMGSVVLLALSGLRGFGLGLIVSSQG